MAGRAFFVYNDRILPGKQFQMRRLLKRILIKSGLLQQNKSNREKIRRDVEIIPVQPNLELEVYWKVLEIGKGPAVILKAYDQEILKFDCFGKDKGHYHVAPHYEFRIYFPEETVLEQIHRTGTELRGNTHKYLALQPDDKFKKIKINETNFMEAIQRAEEKMVYFLRTVPEFEELR